MRLAYNEFAGLRSSKLQINKKALKDAEIQK